MSLRSAISTPSGKQQYVRRMFATIADRYDLITVFLSYGLDRRWKDRLIRLAAITADDCVLDLACGTGDILFRAAKKARLVVGLDVTLRMLQLAAAKRSPFGGSAGGAKANALLVAGDMLALPFPPSQFTVVTVGYGLRNVPDIEQAIDEIASRARPRRPPASARFQPAGATAAARGLSAVPDDRRLDARLCAASRPGHLSLYSGIDSQLSRCRRSRATARAAQVHGCSCSTATWWIDDDSCGDQVRLKWNYLSNQGSRAATRNMRTSASESSWGVAPGLIGRSSSSVRDPRVCRMRPTTTGWSPLPSSANST